MHISIKIAITDARTIYEAAREVYMVIPTDTSPDVIAKAVGTVSDHSVKAAVHELRDALLEEESQVRKEAQS